MDYLEMENVLRRLDDYCDKEMSKPTLINNVSETKNEENACAVTKEIALESDDIQGELCCETSDHKIKKIAAIWVADSGATCHMTNQYEGFVETRETYLHMKFANSNRSKCDIIGTWTGRQYFMENNQVKKRSILKLTDTVYVPNLAVNLFSITKAMNQGASIISEGKSCLTILISDQKIKFNFRIGTHLGFLLGALISPLGIKKEVD